MSQVDRLIPSLPSLTEALRFWLKLGFISFGGPAGQIALLHQELVERRRWISERRFLHALNYCMLLPGPEANQLVIYIGWLLHGVMGGVIAGVLFFLPAFFLLSGLAALYLAYGELPLIAGMFDAIQPAVVAVVLFAAWRIGSRTLHNLWLQAIALLAFIGILGFGIAFPWILLTAGLVGLIGGHLAPRQFQGGGGMTCAKGNWGAALIDDSSPTPDHVRFRWSRLGLILAAFVALWLGSMLLLSGHTLLFDMAWFFTKAAFLTIGGAYAVLPYVYQGGVEEFGWLSGPQMMDGLALGEATPGPLIMVVTWIGFLAGDSLPTAGGPLLAALCGAAVATFFTFLPSFLFILVGGPLVESTRDELHFTAPLTAITAAVVGMILNLAAFFAWHAFWPNANETTPFSGGFDGLALLIAVGSLVALWRYRIDVLRVIGICALLGLLMALAR